MGIKEDIDHDALLTHAIRLTLESMGLWETLFIDQGVDGYVSRLQDGSVVKVTTSPYEVAACLLLMEGAHDVMQVHAVACCGHGIYAIVREDVADLHSEDTREEMERLFLEAGLRWIAHVRRAEDWDNWVTTPRSEGRGFRSCNLRFLLQRLAWCRRLHRLIPDKCPPG